MYGNNAGVIEGDGELHNLDFDASAGDLGRAKWFMEEIGEGSSVLELLSIVQRSQCDCDMHF
jgi:hypothetical protein